MTSYRQSMKDTLEIMYAIREASLLERDLTPDEEKRREEIAKDLPDDDFKKRYGDKWKSVKMATATKMMKNEKVEVDDEDDDEGDEEEKLTRPGGPMDEAKFSAKEIKMAIGIASDKRYKGGNMTGAADAIDKIKPGLSDHPQVRAVLRRQNEETELDEVGGSAFGGTIDKIQKVVDDKQAMKIDGVMVDTFTASLIMNIFNKVNKQNQDKMRKMKVTQLANAAYKLAGVKEEVELDEDASNFKSAVARIKKAKSAKDLKKLEKSFERVYKQTDALTDKEFGQLDDMISDKLVKFGEEVELDEGKMQDMWQKKNAKSLSVGPFELLRGKSGVHTIKQSGKVIGDFSYDDEADNFVANMKGMKGQWTGNDIDSLFTHLQKVHKEEVEIEEASAAADARRAMRRDPDMKQKFSKDVSATDDDKKAASKNIMVQMRKAQSLNGKFDVEFQDGKKVKIPAKMAIAVQQKYNSMRKPADKEKFQAKIGKSYRDMLNALKEAVSPAQQAAIAISKKERGEKPKKESILDRIDRKIKENKNG